MFEAKGQQLQMVLRWEMPIVKNRLEARVARVGKGKEGRVGARLGWGSRHC